MLCGWSDSVAGGGYRLGVTNAETVTRSEPASIDPSRSIVFQEMVSPGPKQPQLISWHLK